MRRAQLAALTLLLAAGVGAAMLTFPQGASAWDIHNLPPGFIVVHGTDSSATTCREWYGIGYQFHSVQKICTDSPTFQADVDSFVNANYTAPVTTTDAPTTSALPPVTTTVVLTTTTPAATTTAATTTTAAPATTTTAAPAAPAVTSTVTVTTTVTPVEQSLQSQINTLAAQIAAVTDRVTRLEKAGDASWLAFQQAVTGGSTVADAAGIARSTYLDALYGLGPFAP